MGGQVAVSDDTAVNNNILSCCSQGQRNEFEFYFFFRRSTFFFAGPMENFGTIGICPKQVIFAEKYHLIVL